jgi:hypothetical protein
MKNESQKALTFVTWLIGSCIGIFLPLNIARYVWNENTSKIHIILSGLPFIVIMISILLVFRKRRILSNNILTNLMKVFFIGLGVGSIGVLICLIPL